MRTSYITIVIGGLFLRADSAKEGEEGEDRQET